MNILHLVRNLDIGGAQEVVSTLASAQRRSDHRVMVATLSDGPLRADLESRDIPVVVIDDRTRSILHPVGFLRDLRRVRRELIEVIDRDGVEIVQTHLMRVLDFVAASLRTRWRRVSVFWTIHNAQFTLRRDHLDRHGWTLVPKRVGYRLLYRLFAGRVDGVIAVSEDVRIAVAEYLGSDPQRIPMVPNGVDVGRYGGRNTSDALRSELGLGETDRIVVTVATFKEQKGHRYLLDAFERVARDHPDVHLVLVGDGDLRPAIEQRVAVMTNRSRVHLMGSRRDVADILAATDVFVLPSLWEGLPMALLEAMAAGCACIASEVSGTSDVVVSGVSGVLVKPGNVDELADALDDVLSDQPRAAEMAAMGRERVATAFSADLQADRHEAVYRVARSQRQAGSAVSQ